MRFAYKAVTTAGRSLGGAIEAVDRAAAVIELRDQGMYVTHIVEQRGLVRRMRLGNNILQKEIHFGAKVKSGEFSIFTRQLATLLRAGVSISETVHVLGQQTQNKTFAKALAEVAAQLQKGNQLSQAAGEQRDIFPSVFINMVRAGEASGTMDEILDRMAMFFEKEHYTREKVKSALTYPIVVSVLAVAVTIFLLVKVVPTFVNLFASFHATLPLPTRIVLAVSHAVVHTWYIILAVIVLAVIGYRVAARKERGKFIRDTVLLRMPIFGILFQKSVMARMGRTMSTLFASAVPILQALQLTSDVVENAVVARALKRCAESLSTGQSLSDPLSHEWVFPPLVVHMVKVGEQTGSLDTMLTKVAEFYEMETEATVDRLKSLIEPLMILFLSAIVGTIVTAIITPMFALYQNIGGMG